MSASMVAVLPSEASYSRVAQAHGVAPRTWCFPGLNAVQTSWLDWEQRQAVEARSRQVFLACTVDELQEAAVLGLPSPIEIAVDAEGTPVVRVRVGPDLVSRVVAGQLTRHALTKLQAQHSTEPVPKLVGHTHELDEGQQLRCRTRIGRIALGELGQRPRDIVAGPALLPRARRPARPR